jgi:hypothetical protein
MGLTSPDRIAAENRIFSTDNKVPMPLCLPRRGPASLFEPLETPNS